MATIYEIEKAVKNAFKKTVKDYRSDKIELEEDCRACFYHHIRPFIDRHKELEILLSHRVQFVENKIIRPDVFIFRKNEYLFAIEIKCDTPQSGYDINRAKKDKNRLKDFSKTIRRGCFIHFDQMRYNYNYNKQDWHNNYYIELYHIHDVNETYCYEVKKSEKKHNNI